MAVKHKNIYLFLALACFIGIIVIFIFDGYIGVYDSLVMDNGQFKQTVDWEEWANQEKYRTVAGTSIERNGQADFTYVIENHRFSEYNGSLEVTLWSNKVKVADLISQPFTIPAFDKAEATWSVNAAEILPANYNLNQNYVYIVNIKTADVEREVNINIYVSDVIKTIPAP